MDRKKFYIIEIIVSAILAGLFIAALFMPLHFKPGTTPSEIRIFTVYFKAILILAAGGMGMIIVDRAKRLKPPENDYPFIIHYDD